MPAEMFLLMCWVAGMTTRPSIINYPYALALGPLLNNRRGDSI